MILITLGFIYLALRSQAIQTKLVNKLAVNLSEDIKGSLGFKTINITFFNRVRVTDFLVSDAEDDTLLYSPFVDAGIRKIKKKDRLLHLGRIKVEEPLINIKPDSSGKPNILYYIDLIIPDDTAKRNRELSISQLKITRGSLSYKSGKAVTGDKGIINPSDLSLRNLNLTVDNLNKLWKDVDFSLSELSFQTPQGFNLVSLFSHVDIGKDHFYLSDPTLRTVNSFINSDLIGIDLIDPAKGFDFVNNASLNIKLNSSLIDPEELKMLPGKLAVLDESIQASGTIRGTIGELKGREIKLSVSDTTHLEMDFDLSGLPDLDNTFMFIDIEEFGTSTSELLKINIPEVRKLTDIDELKRLGNISFSGNFTGFITDFVTYGRITTQMGSISTDILFRPDTMNSFIYKGSVSLDSLNLRSILDLKELNGYTSASFDVDGVSQSFSRFRARINGIIDNIQFNNYTYRGISIEGLATERMFDGAVSTDSRDIKLDLLGLFDFSDSIPELDFSLNLEHADLHKLNIDRSDSTSQLSMLLTANIVGDNPGNIRGNIRMLNSRLQKNNEELELYDLSLSSGIENNENILRLQTDFANAELRGNFDLQSMAGTMKYLRHKLMPSYNESDSIYTSSGNNFTYKLEFKDTDKINRFFRSGMLISPGTYLGGEVIEGKYAKLISTGDYFIYKNNSLLNYRLETTVEGSASNTLFSSDRVNMLNRISLDNFSISGSTVPDSISTGIYWEKEANNKNTGKGSGFVALNGSLGRSEIGNPVFTAAVMPSAIGINDKQWEIDSSLFIIDSTTISVNNFRVHHQSDYINLRGSISEDSNDTLWLDFNNLDLSALNSLKQEEHLSNEEKKEFTIGGKASGNLLLTDVYNNPLFESNIDVNDFRINEHEHGNVTLISEWDNISRKAEILAFNDKSGVRTFDISGNYNPSNSNISLFTDVYDMPLDILNLALYSFASGVKGHGTGSVIIEGPLKNPSINGSIMASDASLRIDYLQTRFNFSDSIKLKNNSFIFDSILINDERGNTAILDGSVSHEAFNNFDIGLRIDANNIKVLDTRQKDNNTFYGTAFASGVINIEGNDSQLGMNISANTERNTRIFIPLKSNSEVSDYSFISFSESADDTTKASSIVLPLRLPDDNSAMGLEFNLDVTPEAEIQLVFDAKVGDVMRSRGSGTLNMALEEDGKFSMFGEYTIEDGDYLLTLGNIFNKRFVVENGGKISWNGDIADATVDIKAIYRLKASLYELLQDQNYMERIPVECHLNMTGQLTDPMIGFDIYLPTADEQTRTNLRNAINSDEEMSRQFLYLLVMNSFYPDPSYGGSIATPSTGASAMGVTTTEMLSNQLSNWLSQISNDFDIGFTYRPGNEVSTQEVEVALSTQLLNDRVTINGNFDVAGQESGSATNEITGDFDVEVKLTEKVRLKVFNRSNDNILYETAPYTQGFGFFFRQEFNRLKDIFKSRNKDIKKEDEIVLEQ